MSRELRLKIATKLRELREKHGYTQVDLANLSGIPETYIQLFESEKAPPAMRIDTLEEIVKVFKITLSDFLNF